jgi:hypothetical protein
MVSAWQDYVRQLREKMSAEDVETLRCEIVDQAREVAHASAGLLGFGDRVSPAERAALAQLEQAFD